MSFGLSINSWQTQNSLQENIPITTSIIATKKKKNNNNNNNRGNIYTIASLGYYYYYFCNINLNLLSQKEIVARITMLHLNVLL